MRALVLLLLPAVALADVSPKRGSVDPRRLRLERVLEGGDEFLFAAAAGADCRLLAAGRRDGKIAIWDTARSATPRLLAGHEGYVYAVAFARGRRLLASAGADKTVRLWDIESGRIERTLRGHAAPVQTVAFSPDGAVLVSGGADGARVWRTGSESLHLRKDGEPPPRSAACELHVLKHGACVFGVAATNERAATAGSDGVVRLWSLENGRQLLALKCGEHPVAAVAFSPDGSRLASAGFDGKVRLWGTGSGTLLRTIDANVGLANAVAFSPDGILLASAGAEGVKFWDGQGRLRGALKAANAAATGVAFAASGSTAAGTFADNRVRVWSARAAKDLVEAPAERASGFLGVSYSSEGGALVGSVVAGSQAELLGFQANDLIIGVDATPVTQSEDFLNFMRGTFEGDEITVRIRREGEEKFIRAKLGRWR